MVREDGYVKLLDFGVARLLSDARSPGATLTVTDTHPGVILGTPRYMSPEQARGEPASSSSDVFSLGVVLYELATGTHPFESESTLGTLHAIASRATPPPARGMPGHPRLERLLLRMLEKPASRAPAAAAVEAELARLVAGRLDRVRAQPPGGGDQPRQHNLPPQRTPLIGRSSELTSLQGMLLDPGLRLLTLTGPGGTGKTRLAVQVAADLADLFDGGVSFVNLAPIADPWLVISAIALAVGVRQTDDRPLLTVITDHLRSRGATLLLVDNFEQVADAAGLIRELLDACPALEGARHQPSGAAHLRRARVSGPPAAAPRSRRVAGAGHADGICLDRAVRAARHGRPARLRADAEERRRRGRHLPPPRWTAARHRARRGPGEDPASRRTAATDRTAARAADRRRARSARASTDAARGDQVELRPADTGRSRRCFAASRCSPADVRFEGVEAVCNTSEDLGSTSSTASLRSSTAACWFSGAPTKAPALHHARDLPRVRSRAFAGQRRDRRDPARPLGLHAGAGRRRHARDESGGARRVAALLRRRAR